MIRLREILWSPIAYRLAVGLLVAAASAVPATEARAAEAGVLRFRCTNPASGANWPVVVDLDRAVVDTWPASISDKQISWHDPKEGFYDLERATGKLQLRNASSTGGYFLYYTCRSE